MSTITYRPARSTDAERIALLHANSWQENYRGIWQDQFLDHDVIADRLKVWQGKLQHPAPNQFTLLAESAGELVGFVCGYTNYDDHWGTLLDNLHVAKHYKGSGIGKKLIREFALWANENAPASKLYLWVLEENRAARKFYDYLGGVSQEVVLLENPDKSFSPCCRYVWPEARVLISN